MSESKPSYYPLSPLKSALESATSLSVEPFKDDSDPSDAATTEDPPVSLSSKSHAPLRPRLARNGLPANGSPLWRTIKTPLELALLPLVAIGYLAFCYTVHGKAVPVDTYGLYAVTPQHLASIKGGVTSISIIIISIALFPVQSIVSDLKSEEFFRALAAHSHGVPLETVNHISSPSFGTIDMLMAMWRHTCSNYYVLGIVASFFIWVVATLAPGALTINSVLADGELVALAIGAVSPQSVLNGSYVSTFEPPAFSASMNSVTSASITWAEMELGVQYSFGTTNTTDPDYAAYIAPFPLDLSTSTSARWLSDVIGINPTCSWASTNLTTPVQIPSNSTTDTYLATAYLLDFNLDVQVTSSDLSGTTSSAFATVKNPLYDVTNHTTQAPASDGSTVFLLGQCTSGCTPTTSVNINIDMKSLSTTFTLALSDQTWSMALLTCLPNITINTREVRNDGHGILSVQPLPANTQLKPQGNLDPLQTTAMFSIATMSITQNGGALSGTRLSAASLGSQVQGDVLFGHAQFEGLPGTDAPSGTVATVTPASIESITEGYTQILQSAAKSYLAGDLGTAYVPGRISASEIVFAASIPNLAASSAVFALLAAVIVIAHLRRGKDVAFTLVDVAAAIHGSEIPALCAQAGTGRADGETDVESGAQVDQGKVRQRGDEGGGSIVEALGDRRVFMQRRVDGSPMLHMS